MENLQKRLNSADGLFKGVVLIETAERINRLQFYQAVIDNLTKRLPDSELVNLLKPLNTHFCLCKLTVASKIYFATSAECERGFSALNDMDTKSRK